METSEKEIEKLKEKNRKLKEQFSGLLDGYAKLELTDLKHNLQVANQQKLIDFIQRIAKRLDDDDLLDVLVEEFMIELGAERVSYILAGSGPLQRLAVSNEAVEKNMKRLPLPYFISAASNSEYTEMLHECLKTNQLLKKEWPAYIDVIPENAAQFPLEQSFQVAMEEEFNVVHRVSLKMAIVFPIKTTTGGISLICVQRSKQEAFWTDSQIDLFKDMCRYAGILLEHMQLTQEIKDLKDQLSSIIQSMPSAIIGMDLLGTITMWGGRAKEMFEVSEEDALGHIFWGLIPQYQFIADGIMDVMGIQDDSYGLEFDDKPYKRKDGRVVHHHANLFTMFGSNRGELALRIDDVTKNVELNNQLFHSQRMEIVGTLAGGLAHDFNNILGGLVGTLSLLKKRTSKKIEMSPDDISLKEDREDMEIMETCTARAAEMVKRLLSISRKSVLKVEPLNLSKLIENTAKLCRASFESRIKVDVVSAKESLWIMADKTQLEQVVLNLCVNARDAMKAGGKLTLEISGFKVTEAFKNKHPQVSSDVLVELKISDTGEGIDLKDLDKIFDPFFTTKPKEQGTGLGLSIVDKIIKEHDGILELKSEINVGTTFSIYFNPTAPQKQNRKREKEPLHQGIGDILVVDDDDIMRSTISRILSGLGYIVATANGGAAALRIFESLHFDLVVMDVDMPIMNGMEVSKIMREKISDIKILYCTARQNQYQMQDELLIPNTWLINKPFSLEDLGIQVRNCLSDKAAPIE